MKRCVKLVSGIILVLVTIANSQDLELTRTDISYEIIADSISLNNAPQDINIFILCESAEEINSYVLISDNVDILWTIVSADLNDQPLWLIVKENQTERKDVLAWQYEASSQQLRFYPPQTGAKYELQISLRGSLLRTNGIKEKSDRELILAAESRGALSKCSIKGEGNRITFK